MARKRVTRHLPPLTGTGTGNRRFTPDQNGTEIITDILRKLALQARKRHPHPFYPVRDVARCFRVSTNLVARVYQRLATEGLLIRKRGSMTLLTPKKEGPRIGVRGIVGIPVWTPGFLVFSDWRLRFLQLEHEFRRHNYIANFIFSEADELATPAFLDRLLDHELDVLFWTFPLPEYRNTMMTLSDRGVRLVSITDETTFFPGLQYALNWKRSVSQGLAAWHAAGISRLVIGMIKDDNNPIKIKHYIPPPAFRTFQVDCELLDLADRSLFIQHLASLPKEEVGIILLDDFVCADLFTKCSVEMIQLCRNFRVMQKPSVTIPSSLAPGLRADIVGVDWHAFAAKAASDIALGRDIKASEPVPFFADWKPRTALDLLWRESCLTMSMRPPRPL